MLFASRLSYFVSFTVLMVINSVLSFLVIGLGMDWLFRENNFLENTQVILLITAGVVFLSAAIKLQGRHQFIAYFFTVLSFIFIFREVDFDRIEGMPSMLVWLLADEGRVVFFVLLLLPLLMILKDIKYYWLNLRTYLCSSWVGYLSISAFLLIVMSYVFEKRVLDVAYYVLFEELSEMSAYYLMVAAALALMSSLNAIEKKINDNHLSQ